MVDGGHRRPNTGRGEYKETGSEVVFYGRNVLSAKMLEVHIYLEWERCSVSKGKHGGQ